MLGQVRLWIVMLLLLAFSGCLVGGDRLAGQTPLARFTMLDGSYTSVYAFRGKTLVVAFWSTESRYSQKMMKRLNSLAEGYQQSKDIVFLAVSIDRAEDFGAVKKFIFENQLSKIEHVFSGNDLDDEAYVVFRPGAIPYFYVLNPAGVVIADGSGLGVVKDNLP